MFVACNLLQIAQIFNTGKQKHVLFVGHHIEMTAPVFRKQHL